MILPDAGTRTTGLLRARLGEHGEGRVGPVRSPSPLAGVLLRVDLADLAVLSSGDEWVITRGERPPGDAPHHRIEATTTTGALSRPLTGGGGGHRDQV
ncbi:MAG: hypothetical protein ABWY11_25240 [Umezawaea sp.]